MSDFNNSLEIYLAEKLKSIDKYARKTRGSGCGSEIADISNSFFYIEAKRKLTKDNIIVDYKKEWLKLLSEMPINTLKIPFMAVENKQRKKFIILDADDFFEICNKAYGEKNG